MPAAAAAQVQGLRALLRQHAAQPAQQRLARQLGETVVDLGDGVKRLRRAGRHGLGVMTLGQYPLEDALSVRGCGPVPGGVRAWGPQPALQVVVGHDGLSRTFWMTAGLPLSVTDVPAARSGG